MPNDRKIGVQPEKVTKARRRERVREFLLLPMPVCRREKSN
jgi:hypothetical protein